MHLTSATSRSKKKLDVESPGPLFGLWTVHYLHALTYVTLFWLPREWRLFQQLESGLGYFTQVYSQIRDILSSQT